MYKAIGVSRTGDVELQDFNTETECREWVRGYVKGGDFGGYDGIAVVSPQGEWVDFFEPMFAY